MKKLIKFKKKQPGPAGRRDPLPNRLHFLFFIVFLLFIALIVQLSYLQIANGQRISNKLAEATTKSVKGAAPRGNIYDANGKALVTNKANQAITYTKGNDTTSEEMFKIANKLNELISVPADEKLTKRDRQDFFLADPEHFKEVDKRLSKKEKTDANGNSLDEGKIYQKMVDKVTEEEITFDAKTSSAATIYKRMNSAYALTTVFIKSIDVTPEEIAIIGEHSSDLKGIATGTDWEREYPMGDVLKSVLGTVSTEQAGLPENSAKEYLAKGYARNDRVGTSYLEKQYEQVLQGTKSESKVTINHSGDIEKQELTYAGSKGQNLVLTVDTEFEKKMQGILKAEYQTLLTNGKANYSDGIYAVAVNPKNGAVLGMSGYSHDTGATTVDDDSLGNINKVFVPGSVVKGATITMAYQNKVISGNETLIDEPIVLAGSNQKSSIFNTKAGNQIPMNVTRALGESSNAYMMKVMLKMMGVNYSAGMQLPLETGLFATVRHTYEQYGLGADTGIDLPGASSGFVNTDYSGYGIMGNLLDLSYGNYDNYTPLQLVQYVSTIANSGDRYAPYLVQGIYDNDKNGNLGNLLSVAKPKLLNHVKLTSDEWSIIHDGFYQTTHNASWGSGYQNLHDAKWSVSGKTGTAETAWVDPNNSATQVALVNSSFIGYAPSDDPQIAIAVMIPRLKDADEGTNTKVAKQIFDAYHDIQEAKKK